MNSLQIIYNNALCTHLCSSLSSRPLCSDILICIQNIGKNPIIIGRRQKRRRKTKVYDGIQGYWFSFQHIREFKAQPQGYRLCLSSKIAGRATKTKAQMGVLEFFYYQEISAMLLTQSKNFLPLFLTLFLHKK